MTGKPELLCPAGGMEQLKTALHFGADAVYGAMHRYGLRAFAGNFDRDGMEEAVRLCHACNARFYLTLNIFPFDDEIPGMLEAAGEAREMGVDAVIVSDLGAICELRRHVPQLPLHVSTQASTVNASAIRHYASLGCRRVILAREVSLERMRGIRRAIPVDMELECFIHGASCVAWSGRCLLSAQLTGRSANQGACAQPCRWKYALMEEKRPGEYLPVAEDEHGTYLFSARDLNLCGALPQLREAGIDSFKIEGRMKNAYYIAVVTQAYRKAIDTLAEDEAAFREILPEIRNDLECASHRESDTGFLYGPPQVPGDAEGFHQTREVLGRVTADGNDGWVEMEMKNRFFVGDEVELMKRSGTEKARVREIRIPRTGQSVESWGIGGERILVLLGLTARAGDMLRGPVRNHRM